MSPDAVAVSGPATNTVGSPANGSMRARCVPVARSSWMTAPPAAGIQSESPDSTAWKTGSQPPGDEIVLASCDPRFGGGFQSVGTIQLATSWLPCQTKRCSFQTWVFQASGPQGKGRCFLWSVQEVYVPPFTAAYTSSPTTSGTW